MQRTRAAKAFSLVEIALALGIAAFTLTAMLGLFSVGMNSGKQSANDTLLAAMTNSVVTSMRRQHFDDGPDASGVNHTPPPILPGSAPVAYGSVPAPTAFNPPVFYFDSSGVAMTDATHYPASPSGTAMGQAAYGCTVTVLADADTLGPADYTRGNVRPVNLLRVQLAFAWPPQTKSANNQRAINVSLARY